MSTAASLHAWLPACLAPCLPASFPPTLRHLCRSQIASLRCRLYQCRRCGLLCRRRRRCRLLLSSPWSAHSPPAPYSFFAPARRYGRHWYYTGATFFIVSRYSYGCYSCYGSYRTCYSCSGCNNRRDCSGGRSENTLASQFDRYEIAINFDLPAAGSDAWPLTLKVDNFTIFAPRKTASATPTQAANGYLTFVTSAGDTFESIGGFLSPVGWIATVFLSIIIVCKSRQLFPPSEARRFEAHRPSALAFASAHGGVQLASAPMQPVSYGQQVYAQPMQPVAVAQPVGCQPVAMAVAQPMAYPGQGGVVYPQQGYPGQGGGLPMATYVQRQ